MLVVALRDNPRCKVGLVLRRAGRMADIVPFDRSNLFQDVSLLQERRTVSNRRTRLRQRVDKDAERRAEQCLLDEVYGLIGQARARDIRAVIDFVEVRYVRRFIIENHDADAARAARDCGNGFRLEVDDDLRQTELFGFVCHLLFLLCVCYSIDVEHIHKFLRLLRLIVGEGQGKAEMQDSIDDA